MADGGSGEDSRERWQGKVARDLKEEEGGKEKDKVGNSRENRRYHFAEALGTTSCSHPLLEWQNYNLATHPKVIA